MAKDPFADFRVDEQPTDEAYAKLHKMVQSLVTANRQVTEAEDALKKAQGAQRQLKEFDIPEYMTNTLGLEEVTLSDGLQVAIIKKIRASIGDRKAAAFAWLIENNHDGLIKRTVQIAFNRDQAEQAEKLMGQLAPKFAGVKQDMKVEAASLTAWVKEQLKEGKDIPLEIFGVFEQKFAEVTVK